MLEHENSETTAADSAATSAPRTRTRRRAASRPAGPPPEVTAPPAQPAASSASTEPSESAATSTPSTTAAASTDTAAQTSVPSEAAAPDEAAPAKRPTRRRATKPAGEPVPVTAPEASTASTDQPPAESAVDGNDANDSGSEPPARRRRGRSTKAASSDAETTEASAREASPEATAGSDANTDQSARSEAAPKRTRRSRAKVADADTESAAPQLPVEPTDATDSADAGPSAGTDAAAQDAPTSAATTEAEAGAPRPRTRRRATRPTAPPPPVEVVEQITDAEEDDQDAEASDANAETVEAAAGDETAAETTEPDADPSTTDEDSADDDSDDDSDDDDSDDNDNDDNDDSSDDGSPRRRRRRRGGRRRRRSSEGDSVGSSNDDDSSDDDDSDSESDSDEGGSSNDDDAPSSGRRRRRRRRRRGEDNSSGSEDESVEIVERVREPRKASSRNDEITGIEGSTRMEAKRQRRREGRQAGRRRSPVLSEAEFLSRREAVTRSMVIRQNDELIQIGVLEDDVLVEHYVDRDSAASLIGNVYLGRVQNVLPSMEAAFIDIGRGRNAVLYAGDVDWSAFGDEGQSRQVEKVLKSGQTIMVQVTKDPVGAKGARLTHHISMPGRYIVYSPGGHLSGISRKLPDTERHRLRDILNGVIDEAASVIVRTAAEGVSEEELVHDVTRLKAQWEAIAKKGKGSAPQQLYGEPDLTLRIVRDLFTEDFSSLIIDGNGGDDDAYDTVTAYVAEVAPHLSDRIERWDESKGDIFAAHRIDEQISKAMERKVHLPSGGSLVIDRTEAMTVIDVNTGKFTGTGGNLEATVTSNNLEAAEEVVRQLRLRDIGGIIVIDFIDMVLPSNRELLLRRLVECLGRDRTRHQVAEVTSLGLVQMTRKKIGTGLDSAFSEPCETCQGRGYHVHQMPVASQTQADGGERRGKNSRNRRNKGNESRNDNRNDNRNSNSGKGGDSAKQETPETPQHSREELMRVVAATVAKHDNDASQTELVDGAQQPDSNDDASARPDEQATGTTDGAASAAGDEAADSAAGNGQPPTDQQNASEQAGAAKGATSPEDGGSSGSSGSSGDSGSSEDSGAEESASSDQAKAESGTRSRSRRGQTRTRSTGTRSRAKKPAADESTAQSSDSSAQADSSAQVDSSAQADSGAPADNAAADSNAAPAEPASSADAETQD